MYLFKMKELGKNVKIISISPVQTFHQCATAALIAPL